ncbi:MAG: lipid-A-disaccharide synthase, partial [Woeseiaceae bacterium]|nr:lipid-A-disaccharide synthase [Woeseiaceae bacterium]
SRQGEVKRLGGILADAAARLAVARPHIKFVTPVATPALRPLIERQIEEAGIADRFTLLDGNSETAMMAADVVLLASGTAALESALLSKPTVAIYRLARMTHAIAIGMRLVKLTHYTLPNLLTVEPLVPELMQQNATPEAIAGAVTGMLDDPERRRFIAGEFAKLRSELALNADQRAADAVLAVMAS